MISAELIISILSELTPQKVTRNIHGDFKRFELLLSPNRLITDEKILYISTLEVFETLVKNIKPTEGQLFSFILAGNKTPILNANYEKMFCINTIDLPIDLIVNEFSKYESSISVLPPANANRYASAFLIDLVEGHLTENEEIVKNIKRAPITLKQHISIVVIEAFKTGKSLRIGVVEEFAECFPDCLATYHNGNILILTQKNNYTDPVECNIEQFENILRYYDAIAVQGNYTKWLTSVRPSYTMIKHCMKYVRLNGIKKNRLFQVEDFCLDRLVEVCATYAPDYTLGDIHHICSPIALELYQNSEEQNEDYDKIVATFIDCDRNISKTADMLFYNRNTLAQKLNRMEIVCESFRLEDLENPQKRYAIRLSLLIIDYIKDVMQRKSPYTAKELIPPTVDQL